MTKDLRIAAQVFFVIPGVTGNLYNCFTSQSIGLPSA